MANPVSSYKPLFSTEVMAKLKAASVPVPEHLKLLLEKGAVLREGVMRHFHASQGLPNETAAKVENAAAANPTTNSTDVKKD